MLNFLLKTCVCVSIACHSSIVLPNINNFDVQEVIKSEFDVNLRQLKKNYLEKINELKEEATNSTLNGINFNVTKKLRLNQYLITTKPWPCGKAKAKENYPQK